MKINFSYTDKEELNEIVNILGKALKDSGSFGSDTRNVKEERFSNHVVVELGKYINRDINRDVSKVNQVMDKIDEGLTNKQKQILTPEKLKDYYKNAYKRMETLSNDLNQYNENREIKNPNEEDLIKSLVKALDLTMNKLKQKFEAQQQEINKELDKIMQMEEHEKKQNKGFGNIVIEQTNQAFDALASIILPPDWYLKAKEQEQDVANTIIKPKEKNLESIEQQPSKSNDNNLSLANLGNLTPSTPISSTKHIQSISR